VKQLPGPIWSFTNRYGRTGGRCRPEVVYHTGPPMSRPNNMHGSWLGAGVNTKKKNKIVRSSQNPELRSAASIPCRELVPGPSSPRPHRRAWPSPDAHLLSTASFNSGQRPERYRLASGADWLAIKQLPVNRLGVFPCSSATAPNLWRERENPIRPHRYDRARLWSTRRNRRRSCPSSSDTGGLAAETPVLVER